ncbi:hypothetical protein UP10_41780 [Bradyrhizobium sp. LTSPM299]|nr:hypothetical protein UP10_41780 [Bradyrhizobium sp. LTSPM299]
MFKTAFLRKMARRGLRGVKLVVSTPTRHQTPAGMGSRQLALANAGKGGRRAVSAFIAAASNTTRSTCE